MRHRSAKKPVYRTAFMLTILLGLTVSASGQDTSSVPADQRTGPGQVATPQEGKLTISGTLVDEKGNPIKDEKVRVLLASSDDPPGCPFICFTDNKCKMDCIKCCTRPMVVEDKTNDKGEFKIKENTDPGKYKLFYLRDEVIGTYYTPVMVDPGETEKVRIDLMVVLNKPTTPAEPPKEQKNEPKR